MTMRPRRGLRLALVTAFPPSTGPLSEYGWHLARALAGHPDVDELHVLADIVDGPADTAGRIADVRVHRCWRFGSAAIPWQVARAVAACRPDAVWLQLHMTSSGNSRTSQFCGLATAALLRAAGVRTMVTMHNLVGPTDLSRTAIRAGRIDLVGAALATRLVCRADLVCVPRPEYADLLAGQGHRNVRLVPLGTPGDLPTEPTAERPPHVLAFGHFGSNKRLEPVLAAMDLLRSTRPDVRLVVAGTSSRHAPSYLTDLARACRDRSHVSFRGYVPEADVPALFSNASISVLPYATMTGMSSVALQSAMYGTAIVASDIPMFRALVGEGLRARLFAWDDPTALADTLGAELDAPRPRRHEAQRVNLAYCRTQSMDRVVATCLALLDETGAVAAAVESTDRQPAGLPS